MRALCVCVGVKKDMKEVENNHTFIINACIACDIKYVRFRLPLIRPATIERLSILLYRAYLVPAWFFCSINRKRLPNANRSIVCSAIWSIQFIPYIAQYHHKFIFYSTKELFGYWFFFSFFFSTSVHFFTKFFSASLESNSHLLALFLWTPS